MNLDIVHVPLLTLPADAVVNRTDGDLRSTAGVSGEIFDAAGKLQLQHALCGIGSCAVGGAVLTDGYRLRSRYIIHTVPPRWCGGKHGEAKLLADCYRNCLDIVNRFGIVSVAFPLLSDERCGYPLKEGIRVAIATISAHPAAERAQIWLTLPAVEI